MAVALDVVVAVLLVVGCLLNLTAAIGLHRFPDLFCRMHAATKPATLGLFCVLAGAALAIGEVSSATKLGLVAVLQLATNPVGGHMIGRAAWRGGVALHPGTRDESEPAGR